MIRLLSICGTILILIGCAPTHRYYSDTSKSYQLNRVQEVSIGMPMLSYEYRQYVAGSDWVILAGLFWPREDRLSERERREHGETTETHAGTRRCGEWGRRTDKSFREELVYAGRSGDKIHIFYKEYGKDFVWPIFSEELQCDLGESRIVVCADYKIEVFEATNKLIRFSVSEEPERFSRP